MIYAGEIIDPNIDALRENMRSDLSFYNFSSKDGIVDARFKGNLSRFINHGDCGDDNLRSEDMMSEGRYKIGFYASRLIEVGEELFFNYDGQGLLYQNFKEKYPFIRSSRRQSNKMRNWSQYKCFIEYYYVSNCTIIIKYMQKVKEHSYPPWIISIVVVEFDLDEGTTSSPRSKSHAFSSSSTWTPTR